MQLDSPVLFIVVCKSVDFELSLVIVDGNGWKPVNVGANFGTALRCLIGGPCLARCGTECHEH